MTSEKLVKWLQILGNFGLIAGLGLVALQIQQNTEITKAQMISDDIAVLVALKLAVIGENPAVALTKAMDSPDELTTEDMIVLENLQMANFYHKSRNEMLSNMGFGVITEQFSSPEIGALATVMEYLGNPYGIAWYELHKDKRGPWQTGAPMTGVEIDVLLKQFAQPESIDADRFGRIREKLQALNTSRN